MAPVAAAEPARSQPGDIDRFDLLRATEYGFLDREQAVYLDYTGAGLASGSQLRAHSRRLTGGAFGNPHSENPASAASVAWISQTRRSVLSFLHADPDEYAVVFTPNATGAGRLVGESYPFTARSRLVLTVDNHASVNVLRDFARRHRASLRHVPFTGPDLRIDDSAMVDAVTAAGRLGRRRRRDPHQRRTAGLLAYPAQSNFSGVRHPLHWVRLGHEFGYDVLLDAAAFLPTNPLRLDRVRPDFVTISWYKVFGYPTGVGCLVARREALARLHRPWFAAGTIAVDVRSGGRLTDDESAFEDGTLNFLSIPDVDVGLSWVESIGAERIQQHVQLLTGRLLDAMLMLRHANGRRMIRLHGPTDTRDRGGTVAFNVLDPDGATIDQRRVGLDAAFARISLRTGCFANPGAGEGAFAVGAARRRPGRHHDSRTVDAHLRGLGIEVGGAARVSLGIASNAADVDRFVEFLLVTYRDRRVGTEGLAPDAPDAHF